MPQEDRQLLQLARQARKISNVRRTDAYKEAKSAAEKAVAGISRLADVVARPTYFETELVRRIQQGDDLPKALAAAGRQFADPDDNAMMWGDLFKKWVPQDLTASEVAPFLFSQSGKGWALRRGGAMDIGLRGTLGLGADIFLDPTTYITFGTGKVFGTAAPRVIGKIAGKEVAIPLSKFGLAEHVRLAQEAAPRAGTLARRTVQRQMRAEARAAGIETERGIEKYITKRLAEQPLRPRLLTDYIARREATKALLKLHSLEAITDPGGIKWLGKTVLSGKRIAGIRSAVWQGVNAPFDASTVARKVRNLAFDRVKSVHAGANEFLDRYFRTIRSKVSEIPGYREARMRYRGLWRSMKVANEREVTEVTKGWKKLPPIRHGPKTYTVGEYAAHHMADPTGFPLTKLPIQVRAQINRAKTTLKVNHAAAVARGYAKPDDPLWRVISLNSRKELRKLSTKYIDPDYGPSSILTFSNYTEAESALKEAGIVPKLEKGFEKTFTHLLDSHAESFAVAELVKRLTKAYGVSGAEIGARVFDTMLPGVRQILLGVPGFQVGGGPFHSPGALAKPLADIRLKVEPKVIPVEVAPPALRKQIPQAEIDAALREVREKGVAASAKAKKLVEKIKVAGQPTTRRLKRYFVGEHAFTEQSLKDVEMALLLDPLTEAEDIVRLTRRMTKSQKALYWAARLRNVTSWKELALVLRHKRQLGNFDQNLRYLVQNLFDTNMRNALTDWGSAHGRIELKRVPKGVSSVWYLPQEMVDDVTQMLKREGGNMNETLARVLDRVNDTNILMRSILTMWPSYHGRNHYSNVITSLGDIGLAAFDPVKKVHAWRLIGGKDGTLKTPYGRYTYDEVRRMMEEYGILNPRDWLLERSRDIRPSGTYRKLVDKVVSPTGLAGKSREWGARIENSDKAVLFMTHLMRGLDPEQAALRTQHFLLDYDDLSYVEREWLRRILLFPTWRTKNLFSVQPTILTTRPGAITGPLKLADRERGPDAGTLPDYMSGRFHVMVKRRGKRTYITNLDLPITSLEDIWLPGVPGTNSPEMALRRNAAQLTPWLKWVVEGATQQELWTGKSLQEQQYNRGLGEIAEKFPKPVQDWLELNVWYEKGEKQYSFNRAKGMLLLRSWALQRLSNFASVIASLKGKSGDLEYLQALAYLTAGTNFKEYDLEEQHTAQVRNNRKRLQKELKKRMPFSSVEVPQ